MESRSKMCLLVGSVIGVGDEAGSVWIHILVYLLEQLHVVFVTFVSSYPRSGGLLLHNLETIGHLLLCNSGHVMTP